MRVPQSSIFIGFFILKHPASGVSPWNAPIFLGSRPGRSWGLSPAAEWWYPRSFLRPKSPMCRTKKTSSPRQMTVNRRQSHPTLIYFGPFLPVSSKKLPFTRKLCGSQSSPGGLGRLSGFCWFFMRTLVSSVMPSPKFGHGTSIFIFGKHIESHELQRRICPSLSRQQIHGMVMPRILLERSRVSSRVAFSTWHVFS